MLQSYVCAAFGVLDEAARPRHFRRGITPHAVVIVVKGVHKAHTPFRRAPKEGAACLAIE